MVIDGNLEAQPNNLNSPYPITRSGFAKITFLVAAKPDIDFAALFDHWLQVHIPNVRETMHKVGGTRYVVSHSLQPEEEAFAGMAELYFPTFDGWRDYKANIKDDGMGQWVADEGTHILRAHTEMVGIP